MFKPTHAHKKSGIEVESYRWPPVDDRQSWTFSCFFGAHGAIFSLNDKFIVDAGQIYKGKCPECSPEDFVKFPGVGTQPEMSQVAPEENAGSRVDAVPRSEVASQPGSFNEFDFRHLKGCPQAVFRPGDRCSCNIAADEMYFPECLVADDFQLDDEGKEVDLDSAELASQSLASVDLDWENNGGRKK